MIRCKEHPVETFLLTLVGAGEDVPGWCLHYSLHYVYGDKGASRFNDIGRNNNFDE
ncbi:MAG TPA: hypothetical protein VHF65_01550 [Nitrososphaera sp.]|nr:hypothetical protein [Nitrososphaera sp.]